MQNLVATFVFNLWNARKRKRERLLQTAELKRKQLTLDECLSCGLVNSGIDMLWEYNKVWEVLWFWCNNSSGKQPDCKYPSSLGNALKN